MIPTDALRACMYACTMMTLRTKQPSNEQRSFTWFWCALRALRHRSGLTSNPLPADAETIDSSNRITYIHVQE